MEHIVKSFGYGIAVIAWLAGMVLAAGALKVIAFIFPPYAWYLLVERAMQLAGVLPL